MPLSVTFSLGAPAAIATIPMAVGDPRPAWPVATTRRVITGDFGDERSGERGGRVVKRVHVAEDLPAARGSLVFATEAGRVVDVLDEFYKGSGYVLVQGDSGLVFVLGEVEPGSVMVRAGDRVAKGQPVARVGRHAQVHFETYTEGTRRTYQWWDGDPPPSRLLNPTAYLTAAKAWLDPTEAPTLPPGPLAPTPAAPVVVLPSEDPEPLLPPQPLQPAQPAQPRPGGGGLLLVALAILGGTLG
jgi:murein DD-endopeptidase MepM/ murein hydrolase activator NlpD